MAIEIIRRGICPEDRTYTTECQNCTTVFKFQASDAKLNRDQRDGDWFEIDCPVCLQRKCIPIQSN